MRHQVFGRKLNRDVKERRALFKSLVIALITHGRIKTTIAKAKAIKGLVDKLVTKAKDSSNGAKSQLASFLTKKEAIRKLTDVVAPKFKDRIGGYLRMIKVGKRVTDNAEEVILEWSIDKAQEKKEIIKVKIEKNTKKKEKKNK